jgi:coproporphyrinogen III oxidase-like Fe-S oxidoreductase
MAQVHRFRDKVAIYVGGGETVYFSPKNARKLAKAINAAARSCDKESFADSSGLTVNIEED